MFKKVMLSALMLTAISAQAEVKLVFDLNEVVVQGANTEYESQQIFLSQNDKSFTLQFICNTDYPRVNLFDKTPLVTLGVPAADDNLGYARVDKAACEKINKCALLNNFNTNGHITVTIDSETEIFSLDSLGDNCKNIN